MNRSRHLVLAAAAVALGLTACGDPNTTKPLADRPPVIELASGQGGSGVAAPAAATAEGAADSKIAFMAPTDFVYDGQLPALDGPSGSWFFAPGQTPDLDKVAKLAASLGVVGEVRTVPEGQGSGWAVGPEDYSSAVLTVGTDGMLSWWLSAGPSAVAGVACAEPGVAIDPTVGTDGGGGKDIAVDVTLPIQNLVSDATPSGTAPIPDVMPPDVISPECAAPQPPAGVPTKDEALAKAKQLFADWGYDVNSYQFDDAYADDWVASVNASLLLDGMKSPIMLSVGFGENASITYASGYLAVPERGADYPTIGAAAGLERLKTQQNQFVGLNDGGVLRATGAPTDASSGVATEIAPMAPCEPQAASADCAPISNEPVTVTLNSVKADLTMVWGADNTIWLLPAYTFGSAEGGMYTVIAVEDAYIHQADPATATTDGGVTDPGVVPAEGTAVAVPAPGAVPDTTSVTGG